MLQNREKYHQYIHFGLLCLLVVAIPISKFLMSLSLILISLNWFARANFKGKFANKQNNILLFSILLLFFIHFFWLANTQDFSYAFHDIRIKLPLFALPLALFTTPALTGKQEKYLFGIYSLAVFLISIVVFYRGIHVFPLEYRSAVLGVSHILFSINVCFVFFIILLNLPAIAKISRFWIPVAILVLLWFIGILLLLQSYTGIFILSATSFLLLLNKIIFSPNKKIRISTTIFVLLLIAGVSVLCLYQYNSYYTPKYPSDKPQPQYTKAGNPYNAPDYRIIEDGNYISTYICEVELKEAWEKRSSKSIETSVEDFRLRDVLVRYLNSKGLPKDAEGVEQLSTTDIENIEKGIPNVSYAQHFSVRKMFSTLFFQWEVYSHSRNAKGSSVFQRLELWGNGIKIVEKNPVFGVGTGDVANEIKTQLVADNSELKDSNMRTHNQYLTFMLTFGIVGFFLALFSLFYGTFKLNLYKKNILFFAFFSIALLSMCSEDTLETQAGCTFFAFFYAYFLSSESQKKFGKIRLQTTDNNRPKNT